ncbi:MAG: hypothetical protein MUE87_05400 [Methanothrix sp.]|nr:hypothetical protein [Methanothrix sp.]
MWSTAIATSIAYAGWPHVIKRSDAPHAAMITGAWETNCWPLAAMASFWRTPWSLTNMNHQSSHVLG